MACLGVIVKIFGTEEVVEKNVLRWSERWANGKTEEASRTVYIRARDNRVKEAVC